MGKRNKDVTTCTCMRTTVCHQRTLCGRQGKEEQRTVALKHNMGCAGLYCACVKLETASFKFPSFESPQRLHTASSQQGFSQVGGIHLFISAPVTLRNSCHRLAPAFRVDSNIYYQIDPVSHL